MKNPTVNNVIYKEFDNFYPCNFKIYNKTWPSSEHYYQAKKSSDPIIQERIRRLPTAYKAWSEGQRVKLREDWENIKTDVMSIGVHEKFNQNKPLKDLLASTNGIIECTGSTPFWNHTNSRILTLLRELLHFNLIPYGD